MSTDADLIAKILSVPSGYAELRLKMKLHPVQKQVLDSLFKDKKTSFRCGNGIGKALWIETPILTMNGWKTMGELQIGDKVFGSNGSPCNVIFTTDVMMDRPCNKVTFSDGSSIIADDEHLWKTYHTKPRYNPHWYRNKEPRIIFDKSVVVMTTKEIKDTLKYKLRGNVTANAHQILLAAPLQYEKKSLPINPYTFGVWLGDGSSSCGRITYHGEKKEIINNIVKDGYEIQNDYKDKRNEVHTATIKGLFRILRLNNLLNNKHIPNEYMTASIEQRMELLRGLMDTDGMVDKRGIRSEFYNTNEKLAYQVYELCIGLGFKATIHKRESKIKGRFISWCWRIGFQCAGRQDVFSLTCKRKRILSNYIPITRGESLGRVITSIERIDTVPVKCIQVDSPDQCYLAGKELIVTHNTSIVLVASILYALEILNAQVVSTAAVYRQITTQLIPNLKKYAHLYPQWEFLDNAISIKGIKKYIGFSTDDAASFQGYHEQPGQPLLILVDEAAGVNDVIFEQIERCRPTYYLACGSPLSPEGEFYKIETDPKVSQFYKHFKLTQYECLKENGYWIERKDVDDLVERKGGRENPLIMSSVYGEFTTNIENAILSLKSLNNCLSNPPTYTPGPRCIGIDFGGGKAETCIYMKIGNRVTREDSFILGDTMEGVDRIVKCLNRLKYEYGIIPGEVNADADGLGLPCIDRLKVLNWNVNKFHGGSNPDVNSEYRNLIAKCWIEGCRKIEQCQLIIPDDNILRMQLLSRKAKLNESGKMQLESKQDMAKRNIESPDRADAFMMAVNGPINNEGTWTSVQPYKPSFGHREYKTFI